jgi:cytochrome c553
VKLKLKSVVVAGAALGLVAAVGCSKGSGQKFTPVGGVATGTGALTSALPTPTRASSYSFDSYQLNAFSGNGRVTALTAAPVGSQILASHAPGSTAALIANGSAADEQAVSFYEAGSMASIDSGAVFLATSDVEGTDAGQVFVRNGTTWNIALNPGLSEASVSKIGSAIYAFAGQEGVAGRVFLYSQQTSTFSEVAAVNSSIPQRGAELNGTVYVGGMNNSLNGGGAQLYRLNGSTLEEIALPAGLAAGNGQGVRQQVTDMLSVTYGAVSGGTASTGSATPATLGYQQDVAALVAADCGSCHAITGIVGTAMLLNSADASTDYTTVLAEVDVNNPAGSELLLKASGGTAHTGGAPWATTSSQYATVLQWITEGAIQNGSPGSSGGGSTTAVSGQLLFMAVGAFARDGGAATGGALLAFNGVDFEVMATYGQDAPTSLAWIDDTLYVGTAAGSLSYRDGNGQLVAEANLPTNTGVLALLARDGDTLAIGAKTNDGGYVFLRTPGAATPAPQPSPQPSPQPTPSALSYATDVAPLLGTSCGVCHANGALVGTAMLFADNTAANDYAVVLAQVNLADPANSNLLLKASNTVTHTGGGPWAVGSAQHTTVMTWIQGGAQQ